AKAPEPVSLDQSDIDKLLAQASAPAKAPEPVSLDQSDIDKLLAQAMAPAKAPEPVSLDQSDIDKLLAQASASTQVQASMTKSEGNSISQTDIDALLASAPKLARKSTVYTAQAIDQSGNLEQGDIDKLLAAAAQTPPPPPQKIPELKLSEAIRRSTVSQKELNDLLALARLQQTQKESEAWERDKLYWAEHRHSSRIILSNGPEPKLSDSLVNDAEIEALLGKHKKKAKLD
ncbi:MAG: hypothetical protein RL095_3844, partial [Verrucomicrobiota bacterium]